MANPDRQNTPSIAYSEQGVLNESRDEKYKVLAIELLGENAAETGLVRLKATDAGELKISGTITAESAPVYSTGSTQSSVSVTNSNTTILASNVARLGATIYNEGSAVCYMKLGSTASTTSYTMQIASGGYYEVPFNYTGIITGITSSGTAQLRITELT